MPDPTYLIVLPSIHDETTRGCTATMHPDIRSDTILIDNTVRNLGVAASWNIGVRLVLSDNIDWLICCSAATRFGPPGGTDFIERLETNPHAWVVEPGIDIHGTLPVVGFHFIAWSRYILETIGLFDENVLVGYGEEVDYCHRINRLRARVRPDFDPWPKVTIDATITMQGHAVKLAGVEVDYPQTYAYMQRKWGSKFNEDPIFAHPFDDPTVDDTFWPVPPDPRSIIPS